MTCEICGNREGVEFGPAGYDKRSRRLCAACRQEVREHGQDPIGVDDEFPDPAGNDDDELQTA